MDKIEECDTCSRAGNKKYVRVSAYGKDVVKVLFELTCGGGPSEWCHTFDMFPLQFKPKNKPGKCRRYKNIDEFRKEGNNYGYKEGK